MNLKAWPPRSRFKGRATRKICRKWSDGETEPTLLPGPARWRWSLPTLHYRRSNPSAWPEAKLQPAHATIIRWKIYADFPRRLTGHTQQGKFPALEAALAQLVERDICNIDVVSSNLTSGSIFPPFFDPNGRSRNTIQSNDCNPYWKLINHAVEYGPGYGARPVWPPMVPESGGNKNRVKLPEDGGETR